MSPLPSGDRRWSAQKLAIILAVCLTPWISAANAQQNQDSQQVIAPPLNGEPPRPQIRKDNSQPIPAQHDGYYWDATIDGRRETPIVDKAKLPVRKQNARQQHTVMRDEARDAYHERRRRDSTNYDNIPYTYHHIDEIDESGALAPVAPAEPVRAHPPRHNRPNLASPQLIARSLGDWEVEDFVLLATVGGDLYASDRKTGKERWHLEVDQPMVYTKRFRGNTSVLDDEYDPVDHYIWAVEPSRDGELYIWTPDTGSGLVTTGLTMKEIVEVLAPFSLNDPPVVYTGDKKTTVVTLDAATGRILKWFGSGGSHIHEEERCTSSNGLYGIDSEECSSTGTITLGRNEYTVAINRKDGKPIANLRYSEWTLNNADNDLLEQHRISLDSHYMTSKHDGKVYVFDIQSESSRPLATQKFDDPVARVFDVCRPWNAKGEHNAELTALPQPTMPISTEEDARARNNMVFLNQTEDGSWYALSGRAYPLIVHAPPAMVSRPDWLELMPTWDTVTNDKVSLALVGTHFLGQGSSPREFPREQFMTLPEKPMIDPEMHQPSQSELGNLSEPPSIINRVRSLPQSAANSVIDAVSNPVLIIFAFVALIYNEKQLRQAYRRFKNQHSWKDTYLGFSSKLPEDSPVVEGDEFSLPEPQQPADDLVGAESRRGSADSAMGLTKDADGPVDEADGPVAEKAEAQGDAASNQSQPDTNGDAPPPPKKKARRGRRAGQKHPKKKQPPQQGDEKDGEGSQGDGKQGDDKQGDGRQDDENSDQVEHAVHAAKNFATPETVLQPDAKILKPDANGVMHPVLRLGNMEVELDNQLGTGSNGTVVFAGTFNGRPVAVKRMLIQFFEMASHETRLLAESDDHANVIRYHDSQTYDNFLYIALERCAASLADVVERPQAFRSLAEAGQRDMPGVLYQITKGIHHLHSLRIVHRDLKPQNILVNTAKDGKPRQLVSDFGLCKKLDTGQSSFGATTGHAAGTSGWRAPELLRDDDQEAENNLQNSLHSGSGTVLVADALSGSRRATRSIDVFSLGLVFFYVLTNGRHPFDCGGRYMREANIRNGNKQLDALDALGDFAFEAKSLVEWMLSPNPANRPSTQEVMAHPFFWDQKKRLLFLCDVSDYFEKEPRDPPSQALEELENHAPAVIQGDFLKMMPRDFVESLGKQRKYTGTRLLDLLRALRNKKNHFEDMPEPLRKSIGSVADGYLFFWTVRFPSLLLACWEIVYNVHWDSTDRFREYYQPAGL